MDQDTFAEHIRQIAEGETRAGDPIAEFVNADDARDFARSRGGSDYTMHYTITAGVHMPYAVRPWVNVKELAKLEKRFRAALAAPPPPKCDEDGCGSEPCSNPGGHEWGYSDEDGAESATNRCLCVHCGADGDA